MTNKTEALKPCPFCGGEAQSYFNPSCDCCGHISGVAYCGSCSAEIGHRKTEAEAIAAWNTRASAAPVEPEALGSLVERLREHASYLEAMDPSTHSMIVLQCIAAMTEAATTIATLVAERDALRSALQFYADENNPCPNEGPWGIGSDDFGQLARTTLERTAQP